MPAVETPPSGVHPVFLRGVTCIRFGLKGEGAKELVEMKLIPKRDILNDIKIGGKTSDWDALKSVITDYPCSNVTVILDKTSQYGSNYFVDLSTMTSSSSIQLEISTRPSSPATGSKMGSRSVSRSSLRRQSQYSPKIVLPPISPEEKSLIRQISKNHIILENGKQAHKHNRSIFLSYDSSNAEDMKKVDLLRKKFIDKEYIIYEHDGAPFPCRFNEIDHLTKANVLKCAGFVAFINREYYKNKYCKLLAHYAFKQIKRQKNNCFEAMFVMLCGTFTTYSVPEKIGGWLHYLIKDSLWYPGWNIPHLDGAFESIEKVVTLLALEVDINYRGIEASYEHKGTSKHSRPSSRQRLICSRSSDQAEIEFSFGTYDSNQESNNNTATSSAVERTVTFSTLSGSTFELNQGAVSYHNTDEYDDNFES